MDAAVLDPRTELLLMTVDEYCQLPERQDLIQELHWGQVVHLPRPKMGRMRLQYRLAGGSAPSRRGLGHGRSRNAFPRLSRNTTFAVRMWRWCRESDGMPGTKTVIYRVRRNW